MSVIKLPGLPQDPKVEGCELLAANLDKLRAVLRAQSLTAYELGLEAVAGRLTDIAILLEAEHQHVEQAISEGEENVETNAGEDPTI